MDTEEIKQSFVTWNNRSSASDHFASLSLADFPLKTVPAAPWHSFTGTHCIYVPVLINIVCLRLASSIAKASIIARSNSPARSRILSDKKNVAHAGWQRCLRFQGSRKGRDRSTFVNGLTSRYTVRISLSMRTAETTCEPRCVRSLIFPPRGVGIF